MTDRTELTGGSGGGGGGDDTDDEEGGGGGGAGGTIWLDAPTITITGTVQANGGTGGNGDYSCSGGNGAAGVIAYTGSITGSTTPAATSVDADWVALVQPKSSCAAVTGASNGEYTLTGDDGASYTTKCSFFDSGGKTH